MCSYVCVCVVMCVCVRMCVVRVYLCVCVRVCLCVCVRVCVFCTASTKGLFELSWLMVAMV